MSEAKWDFTFTRERSRCLKRNTDASLANIYIFLYNAIQVLKKVPLLSLSLSSPSLTFFIPLSFSHDSFSSS